MDKGEFEKERKKLEEISKKLLIEKDELQTRIAQTEMNMGKNDFVKEQIIYSGHKKILDIENIKDKPYFARIDIRENEAKDIEKLYIGKLSVIDSNTKEPIIVDWRAPISNLYYDGVIGNTSYEVENRKIECIVSLKRQYFIENQILEKYIDVNKQGTDELLQDSLSENADSRLKNIVATIQEEQNRIIRADINKPLIVQGVAGSGKTTIALHRAAYLIYTYGKDFSPDSFMIIAPNKFFLNYISNVLPDLGVENVKQYTFEDFAYEVIGKKLKISDSNEKLVVIVNKDFNEINKGNVDVIIKESKIKSSIEFKNIVDEYIEKIEKEYLPNKDFILHNVRIMRYDKMQDLFLNTYKNLTFKRRIEEIKKHVFSKIRNNISSIDEMIRLKRTSRIKKLEKENLPEEETRKKRIEIFEEYEDILKLLDKRDVRVMDFYFNQIEEKTAIEYYRDFIENFVFNKIDNKDIAEYMVKNTLANLDKGEVTFEDLAPIIYLHYKIYGTKFKTKLKHVIIDEAQDYGEFQFSTLKTILDSNSMTILGDIAQGVHSYRGIENWQRFIDVEFPEKGATYLTLDKTYRTTSEIMNLANKVIDLLPDYERKTLVKGKPVIHGENSIKIYNEIDETEIVKKIVEKLEEYKEKGYRSIAIIGKEFDECKMIKTKLSKLVNNIKLIKSKDSEYHAGISIVPSYLSKGLEFDAVILYNVNNEKYKKEEILDIKLLYVAMTRAMSNLDIFYTGEKSLILDV